MWLDVLFKHPWERFVLYGVASLLLIVATIDHLKPWETGIAYLETTKPGNLRIRASVTHRDVGSNPGGCDYRSNRYFLLPDSLLSLATFEVVQDSNCDLTIEKSHLSFFVIGLLATLIFWGSGIAISRDVQSIREKYLKKGP